MKMNKNRFSISSIEISGKIKETACKNTIASKVSVWNTEIVFGCKKWKKYIG